VQNGRQPGQAKWGYRLLNNLASGMVPYLEFQKRDRSDYEDVSYHFSSGNIFSMNEIFEFTPF
jgi:hypothetical protein